MRALTALMSALALVVAGCGPYDREPPPADDEPPHIPRPVTYDDVRRETGEAADTAVAYTDQQWEAFLEDARAWAEVATDRLDTLQARSEELALEARERVLQQVEQMRTQRDQIEARIARAAETSRDAREVAVEGLRRARQEIEEALEEAEAEFRETPPDNDGQAGG